MKYIDITGQRFGRLMVKEYAGNSKWLCMCDCGKEVIVNGYKLKTGNTVSCGCKKIENFRSIRSNSFTDESRSKMSESAKKRGMPDNIRIKGIRVKAESEHGGRTQMNRNAKEWHIISPDGKEYKVSNLLLFIRDHAEMFGISGKDEECKYILSRFSVLKWHMKNDRKQSTCCGGWSIEIPEDDRINKYKKE